MSKIFVGFDTIEQAQIALAAVNGAGAPVQQAPQYQQPAPQFQQPAPQQPGNVQYHAQAPAPDAGFVPPMPQGFAPQAPMQPGMPQAPMPPQPQAPAPQAPAAGAASNDAVIKAVQAYSKKYGAAATKNVLSQTAGVTAVKDIQPQYYAAVIAAVAV